MKQCKKQTTYAVIYKDKQIVGIGSNEISADIEICPRDEAGCVSGEGYEMCTDVCKQAGHAEVMACKDAGGLADGGTLYLMGHAYCCNDCLLVMVKHGITEVVIAQTGERFNPLGQILAKKYANISVYDFMNIIGSKTAE